jgi:predicted secreted protein
MAVLTGNDGAITVNSVNVAAVRNFSVEQTADTIETSAMGTDARTYVKGMSSWSGSADIYFDAAEFGTNASTFNITTGLVGAAGVAVKLYVKQDATNDVAFTGDVIVTGYTVNSTMDGLVEASISFQGTGAMGYANSGNV